MLPGARRRARLDGAVAGSVWETRMKMDQVKGGIKVFNAGDNESNADEEEGIRVYTRLRRNQSETINLDGRKKRRNWKPPEPVVSNVAKSPVQLRKARSGLPTNSVRIENENENEEEDDDEIEIEIEGDVKRFDDKEIDLPKKVVEEEKEIEPVINEVVAMEHEPEPDLDSVKPPPIEVEEHMDEIGSETQNRMQNIVDLVMWRDISKSAFVFGFGTFILLSSSYTRDLDFSLLSAISYLALIYLALIFVYKSLLRRGGVEFDEREVSCMIGEEEAIWALRFLLPYINEVLTKIKALFSGDPATTMKLAVLLFVTARCGSCVTLWTLAKLVFFGVFTVPKILSSYSVQLARYGKFWVERFRDAWESCTQKKAVAAAIFTLVWNMSSTVARVWAVFMLVVAVKFYQQCAVEWIAEEEQEEEQSTAVVEQESRREDSKPELIPPGSNHHKNSNNNRLTSLHRQKNGPSLKKSINGNKRERNTTKSKEMDVKIKN